MVQKLESVRGGGGGSIKIGTTGTVGGLMTRELDSIKAMPHTPPSKTRAVSISIPCSASTPARLQQLRRSLDEGSSSRLSSNPKNPTRRNNHRIPMLEANHATPSSTPNRGKMKLNIVEVVDVKCGNPDRAWVSPITTKLKKLGFSKLSETTL